MSRDYREAFYKERFERLSGEVPDFCPGVTWAVITLSWLHDGIAKQINGNLAVHDLTLAAFNVLAILQERERVPLNELSTLLVKTPANVTGLVDGLAKRGLVRRVPHPEDRRVKLAELSSQGRELIERIFPQHHALVRDLFQALDDDELRLFTAMMRRVLDSLPRDGQESQA
jgi:MarR family 2-MHQ and catechol resistance regulon transcriptional repressor